MQVLSFLRCDRSVSAGADDPKPCVSFVLSKLLRELREDGINCSRLAIRLLLKNKCCGHYSLSIAQPFLPEGSDSTIIPSKRSKSGCDVQKCVQIHKSVIEDASVEKLEKGKYLYYMHKILLMGMSQLRVFFLTPASGFVAPRRSPRRQYPTPVCSPHTEPDRHSTPVHPPLILSSKCACVCAQVGVCGCVST